MYVYIYMHLHVESYIYIYMSICVITVTCVCIYIYMCNVWLLIYICRDSHARWHCIWMYVTSWDLFRHWFAEIVTWCVYVCVSLFRWGLQVNNFLCSEFPCVDQLFLWEKAKSSKKQSRKEMAYACSKITDLYGNLQCFVLPRPFLGGGNRVARL